MRTMAEAGLRLRMRGATAAELKAALVELLYGTAVRERLERKRLL
jgi:hypothetical protein